MAVKPFISFEQAQAAMKAIIDDVTKPGGMPVAVSIVDDAGNMVAYAQMDNVRLYARRHAFRKAYTAAVMCMDTGAHGEQLKERGRTVKRLRRPQPHSRDWWSCRQVWRRRHYGRNWCRRLVGPRRGTCHDRP